MDLEASTCDFTADGIEDEGQPKASTGNSNDRGDNICWNKVSRLGRWEG
jgi:hypothetical protein